MKGMKSNDIRKALKRCILETSLFLWELQNLMESGKEAKNSMLQTMTMLRYNQSLHEVSGCEEPSAEEVKR